jgi:dTDP-4-amino-4,6-dideoxy-D-galactose acyltransferase
VDRTARGKGIGNHLMNAAVARAREWGVDQIDVVTQQDNVGACRFYERCGFVPEKSENIYHIWID